MRFLLGDLPRVLPGLRDLVRSSERLHNAESGAMAARAWVRLAA